MTPDHAMPSWTGFTPDDIVREVKNLPSAPKVLPRLKQLLADGNSSMQEVVALIRVDPGIAARVLQVGNSAYFSSGVRCFKVEEAVNRVGYDQIYELVSYAVASQVLVRPLATYGIEADDLWKLSVSCALAAETLAIRTGQERDVAYTAGLLHCLGMVAVDEWALHTERPFRLKSEGYPVEASAHERAVFGFTQGEVGCALLKQWNFPSSMAEPLRWQYSPLRSVAYTKMACLLHAAKWLRSAVCAGSNPRPALPAAAILQPLQIAPEALPALLPEVENRLAAVSMMIDGGNSAKAKVVPSFVVGESSAA
jgi:HD-like signal output (HDOD) protein